MPRGNPHGVEASLLDDAFPQDNVWSTFPYLQEYFIIAILFLGAVYLL